MYVSSHHRLIINSSVLESIFTSHRLLNFHQILRAAPHSPLPIGKTHELMTLCAISSCRNHAASLPAVFNPKLYYTPIPNLYLPLDCFTDVSPHKKNLPSA